MKRSGRINNLGLHPFDEEIFTEIEPPFTELNIVTVCKDGLRDSSIKPAPDSDWPDLDQLEQ